MPYTRILLSTFLFSLLFVFYACKKDTTIPLVDESFHTLQINTGVKDNIIAVQGNEWQVEYVKLTDTREQLLDSEGNPMTLIDQDETQHIDGWITLKKTQTEYNLSISLDENFADTPRSIEIGLRQNKQRDIVRITQSRGESYKIVEKKFDEIPESDKVYITDEDCTPITLSNNSAAAKQLSTDAIFNEVRYSSQFISHDQVGFDWRNTPDQMMMMPDLQVEDAIRWSGAVLLDDKLNLDSYVGEGKTQQTLKVEPHTNVDLEGTITYAERTLNYTFTIQNESSGHRFTTSGIWKQKVPISSTVIIKRVY